jgi:hypothetical protein
MWSRRVHSEKARLWFERAGEEQFFFLSWASIPSPQNKERPAGRFTHWPFFGHRKVFAKGDDRETARLTPIHDRYMPLRKDASSSSRKEGVR